MAMRFNPKGEDACTTFEKGGALPSMLAAK
jgi:hypothetical protein